MKKTILTGFLMASAFIVSAQSYYKIVSNSAGTWNTSTHQWEWASRTYAPMTVTIKGKIILIGDNANSSYIISDQIIDDKKDDYTQVGWNAKDEKGRGCVIKIASWKNGDCQIYAMYADFAWAYNVSFDENSISKF